MFCWLMVKDELLTNVNQVRRNINVDNKCLICKVAAEDAFHTLKDYRVAKGI